MIGEIEDFEMINKKFVALITDYVKNYQEKNRPVPPGGSRSSAWPRGRSFSTVIAATNRSMRKSCPSIPSALAMPAANAWSGCPVQWRFPVKLKNEKVINNLRTAC